MSCLVRGRFEGAEILIGIASPESERVAVVGISRFIRIMVVGGVARPRWWQEPASILGDLLTEAGLRAAASLFRERDIFVFDPDEAIPGERQLAGPRYR